MCHYYVFVSQRAMQVPKSYNQNLVGLSLKGQVGEVKRDCVTVTLDEDEEQGKERNKVLSIRHDVFLRGRYRVVLHAGSIRRSQVILPHRR